MTMTKTDTAGTISGTQLEETVTGVLKNINEIDPAKIQCMLGVIVVEPEEGSELNGVHVYAIGTNNEIAKMVVQLIESSSNGIRTAKETSVNEEGVVH